MKRRVGRFERRQKREAGRPWVGFQPQAQMTNCAKPQNVKRSDRSSRAGEFVGTYGFDALTVGLGKLSRLRPVNEVRLQLRSMNFNSETWSP